ncbi:MAG: hypothetical protein ACR2PZ_23020 [Pseudomonadales bacterium]
MIAPFDFIDPARPSRRVGRCCAALLAILLCYAAPALGYEFPHTNPYLATVVGTPVELQAKHPPVKLKTKRLPVAVGRNIPDVLSYGSKLEYSIATQRGPAPLIFVLAGTGGDHNSSTNASLMQAFHAAGFHVVGISSPTHPKFVIAASTTAVPGNMSLDAQDLYRVMGQIWERHKAKLQVTSFHLTGSSLGGIQAAFVAQLDDSQRRFDFERVLLINSPVSLYSSVSKLDRMLENIPGGVDNFDRYFDRVVSQIGAAYNRSTSVEFNQDLVFAAFAQAPPTHEDLAAIIGVAFRMSGMNMIFTADLMTNFGFIKPKELVLPADADLGPYTEVAMRVGFTDYFHEFMWPFYEDQYPNMDRQAFAEAQSLVAIADYLQNADNIFAVHNQDDIILARNEIEFFHQTFGDRLKVYPVGGHLGNVVQHETLSHIVSTITDGISGARAAAAAGR